MAEWVSTDGPVRAVGRGGAVTLETVDWRVTPPRLPLPYPADVGLTGEVRELSVDEQTALADQPTTGGEISLPEGEHLLQTTDSELAASVRFRGPADVVLDEGTLRFSEPSPVSIGLSETAPEVEELTVPPTPAGLAAAVTISSGRLPEGPERSFGPTRPHPPLITFNGDCSVPATNERDLVFGVPDDLETVLVAAPLAYYLGATLQVGTDLPVLRSRATGYEYAFNPLPAFASELAAALRRVVHLDRCSRRVAGETVDRSTLTVRGLDAETIAAVSPAVRYATFLDAEVPELPAWHLSAYVDATYERAQALPALLDRLALIYPAEATEMTPSDLLESSLDDFYRGAVSVTPLAPELGVGDCHTWLADGEVVDACKTMPAAYEHARKRGATGETLDVTVVLNDPEMDAELSVVEAYQCHAETVPIDVTVRESLSTVDLATVLESSHDFLHYIGHCEAEGLQCSDGYLSTESLDAVGPRAFFLNACGSYHEGEQLVEQGSVAGAVTLEKVLNEQAATVGTAFGRLVVAGYGVDRALSVARRRVLMGRDYAAVGDGTARIAPTIAEPAVVTVDPAPGGRFEVTYEPAPGAGGQYVDPFDGTYRPRGDPAKTQYCRDALAGFLDGRRLPVIFDGEFRWAAPLAAELRSTRHGGSVRSG